MWFFRKKTPNNSAASQVITPQTLVIRGRQFAPEAPYALPKDWKEDQRLDMQHFMFRKYMRGNFMAPITNPRTILDAACGTGRWGSEMARHFPNANVYGFDIRPPIDNNPAILGPNGVKPDNYTVLQGDITQGVQNNWENLFDYVHMRAMVLALPDKNWDAAVAALAAMTAQNGWVELVDYVGTPLPPDSVGFQKILSWTQVAFAARGFDFQAGEHIAQRLSKAGLQNIRYYRIDIPIGYSAGEDGGLMSANLEELFRSLKPVCVNNHIVSADEYDAALAQYHQDLVNAHGQSYPLYVAYGQKI